jgi:hypothetical protein
MGMEIKGSHQGGTEMNSITIEVTPETANMISRAMDLATFTGREPVRAKHANAKTEWAEAVAKAKASASKEGKS